MKGIVWGSTFIRASQQLDEIEEEYKRYQTADLVECFKNKYRHELIFSNGDYWKALAARESFRGNKCNISYIDNQIDIEFVDNVIVPSTVAGPYQAFKIY